MKIDLNPFHLSPDVKTFAGVIGIVGSIWTAGEAISGKIYDFGKVQTRILDRLENNEKQIGDMKNDVVPRINLLEQATNAAKNEAAAGKQLVLDMKENLNDLRNLALQNLHLSQSHTEDIKATREAVAPKEAPIGPP